MFINYTKSIRDVKDRIFEIKERISDARTIINNENESMN